MRGRKKQWTGRNELAMMQQGSLKGKLYLFARLNNFFERRVGKAFSRYFFIGSHRFEKRVNVESSGG